MCNSGSSANLLMYAALENAGKIRDKKIVVPATGWATTLMPAVQLGWKPVMCESDRRTFGLDLNYLEDLVKREHPAVVILVHVLGVPCDMTGVFALQRKYGFQILEDCCASHGARHQGRMVGTFGAMSSFSFYYGHHMSTVEGGVVCTNDEQLYYHLLMARSHGWLKDLPSGEAHAIRERYDVDHFHAPFTFYMLGFNVRPTDISAKLGLIQLRKLDSTVQRRIANHKVYQQRLQGLVEYAIGLPGDVISSISFCAVARTVEERRRIVLALDEHQIDTRIFTAGNLGQHPFWRDRYGVFSAPMADRLSACGFFLPNNQALAEPELDFISGVVRNALGK
jgi:CDP-6-deoxy-D-xylo-4-hexulose-3-dehydrase